MEVWKLATAQSSMLYADEILVLDRSISDSYPEVVPSCDEMRCRFKVKMDVEIVQRWTIGDEKRRVGL
jgi:hypothetical protein